MRKLLEFLADVGSLRGVEHFFHGGVGLAEHDVFADGFAEQKRLLRDEADGAPQLGQRVVADGAAVDEHRAGSRIVEARDEVYERSFAGACQTYEGEAGSGGNGKRDIAQDDGIFVGEGEIAKFDVAFDRVNHAGFGIAVVDGRLFDQQLVNADHGCGSTLKQVHDVAERDHGPGEHDGVDGERGEVAGADAMSKNFMAADKQNDDHGNAQHELERGPEHAHQLHEAQPAANVFAVGGVERLDLRLFLSEGANEAGSGEVFLRLRGDVGEHGLDALEAVVDFAPERLHENAGNR